MAEQRNDFKWALLHLVALKDGPRDAIYRRDKDAAWQAARDLLGVPGPPPDDTSFYCTHCPWNGTWGTCNQERNLDLGPLKPFYLAYCPECGDLVTDGERPEPTVADCICDPMVPGPPDWVVHDPDCPFHTGRMRST